jgi:uncharacterized membrane protein YhaH (DUF805 family)
MARFFPKSDIPTTRPFQGLMAMWLAYWLCMLGKGPDESWILAFRLLLTLLTAYLWVAFTAVRLADLRLSRMWIAPILIPIGVAVLAIIMGRPKLDAVAALSFLAVQLPIFLMSRRKASTTTGIASSDDLQP